MTQYNAFIDACRFFDGNNDEQFSMTEFTYKMNEFLLNSEYEAYDPRHIKRKLIEFYGENVIISGGKGSPIVVTHRESANSILKEFFKKPKSFDINLKFKLLEQQPV